MRLYQRLFAAGIAAYAIQVVLALVYYKERMVLPDDANYVFDLVTNGGRFAIFHNRFIAVPSQVLPYLAIRLGWPLGSVAQLYSVNLVLFPAACYLICGFVCKNYKAALVLLLSGLLFTTYTFYWAVSELGLSIALLMTGYALLTQEGAASKMRYLLLAIIMATAACSHSLAVIVIAFMLLFLWLSRMAERKLLLFTTSAYAAALIFKICFLRDAYEAHAMGGLGNFIRLFPDYFSTESARRFRALCLGKYAWVPLVLLLNVWAYIRTKEWKKLALMLLFSIAYLVLITVTFPDVEGHDFYNENLALPIAVFLSVPLVYDALPLLPARYTAAVAVLIVLSGLYRIRNTHTIFSARLDWQRRIMGRYDGRKVILNAREFPKDTLMMAWSSPYEFWLLSTMERGSTASIIIADNPEQFAATGNNPHLFVPAISSYPYAALDKQYFRFPDTVHCYQVIK